MAGKNTQERIEIEMEKYGLVRIKDQEHHRSMWTAMCSCCDNKLEIPQTNNVLVSNKLLEIARRRGWRLGYKHAATCPEHLNKIKEVVKRAKVAQEVTVNERPSNTLQQQPIAAVAVAPPSAVPAPMPIATTLKIAAELDNHFDTTTKRYRGVECDDSIAKRTGFSIEAVKRVRLEGPYGEIAEDPAIATFAKDLAALQKAYNADMSILIDKYDGAFKTLNTRLTVLQGKAL